MGSSQSKISPDKQIAALKNNFSIEINKILKIKKHWKYLAMFFFLSLVILSVYNIVEKEKEK